MSARADAVARLGGRYDARVLEPSPPALEEPPWFADDPVGRDEPRGEFPRVLPVGGGELRWDDLARSDPDLRAWCAERWLGAYRELAPAPASLAQTRRSLHAVAERLLAPARERANGKIGLRYTRAGFGTPFFGDGVQLRVAAGELIVHTRAGERAAPITTLSELARHIGPELLPGGLEDDAPLGVDPQASRFLGDWYGFGTSLLEELRAQAGDELEPSRVQLWPEHFDIGVEIGLQSARATYGASPGDSDHDEPYLYVTPWGGIAGVDELFTATCFTGAELGYGRLLALGDGYAQREAALDFFNERFAALAGRSAPSAG